MIVAVKKNVAIQSVQILLAAMISTGFTASKSAAKNAASRLITREAKP